jgi:hypothetical protein
VNSKHVEFSVNNPYVDKEYDEGNDLGRDDAEGCQMKLEDKDVNDPEYHSDDEKHDCEENRRYHMFLNQFRLCHSKFLFVAVSEYQIKNRCISINGILTVLIQAYAYAKRKDSELSGSEFPFHLSDSLLIMV